MMGFVVGRGGFFVLVFAAHGAFKVLDPFAQGFAQFGEFAGAEDDDHDEQDKQQLLRSDGAE